MLPNCILQKYDCYKKGILRDDPLICLYVAVKWLWATQFVIVGARRLQHSADNSFERPLQTIDRP